MADCESFNLTKLNQLFAGCIEEEDLISLDNYVNAYDELSKLFGLLGSIFGFVVSDVKEKIGILRDYRKSSEAGKFRTVQSMINHEVEQNTTDNKKQASGSRTLLRLHRAMEFTAQLMMDVWNAEEGSKMSSITKAAYDSTLANHHPWLIRKGVHMAVYTLPSRKQMIEKMMIKDQQSTLKDLQESANLQMKIYDIIQAIYKANDLLNLP